jgi:hypothetical protein
MTKRFTATENCIKRDFSITFTDEVAGNAEVKTMNNGL